VTKDPLVHLRQIQEAIGKIEQFTASGRKAFLNDNLIQDGVILNLALIGEAVKKLPESVTVEHPQIEWSEAAKMRDILIHHYDGTDIRIVWDTVKRYLPSLKRVVREELKRKAAEPTRE
jgi:uncharacterized protein with HEPN domain